MEEGLSRLCPLLGLTAPGKQALVLLPLLEPCTLCKWSPRAICRRGGDPRTMQASGEGLRPGVWGGGRTGACPGRAAAGSQSHGAWILSSTWGPGLWAPLKTSVWTKGDQVRGQAPP